MVERSAATHDENNRELVAHEIAYAKSGQSMAGAIALASVLASIVFFALDKTVAGGIMLSLPVTTMIRSFLHRRPSDD